jgi:FtsZ-interacting cell division protein ZipA
MMGNNTIYVLLGILAAIYFMTQALAKKRSKERKSKGFMERAKERKRQEKKNDTPD